jgi:hypothetical protein
MPTSLRILRVFGPACAADKRYSALLAKDHIYRFFVVYATIALLSLLEAPLSAYLPSNASETSRWYHGFPDFTTRRLALYTKLVQSCALIGCCTLYLTKNKGLGWGNHAGAIDVVIVVIIITIACAAIASQMGCTGHQSLESTDNVKNLSNEKLGNALEMFEVRKATSTDTQRNDPIPSSSTQSDTLSPV